MSGRPERGAAAAPRESAARLPATRGDLAAPASALQASASGVGAPAAHSTRASLALLAAGAAAGIALALVGLVRPERGTDDLAGRGAVARVNDVLIRRDEYERALAALAADRRGPPTDGDRQRVLTRLVDEELLAQRGLELGLARADRMVRASLVAAVIAAATADAGDAEPSAAEVAAFYAEHAERFTDPGRLHVRRIVVRVDGAVGEAGVAEGGSSAATGEGNAPTGDGGATTGGGSATMAGGAMVTGDGSAAPAGGAVATGDGDGDAATADGAPATGSGAAEARAAEAARRLAAGEALASVRAALGDPEPAPLPDAPLPAPTLVEYLGPTALRAAAALPVGGVSAPIRTAAGLEVLQLVAREPPARPALTAIEGAVREEYRRAAGERALAAYLDDLRARADVAVSSTLP